MKHRNHILLLTLGIFLCLVFITVPITIPMIKQSNVEYIIDPGHGLPDGGAIGLDGTTEQKLNLCIAQELYALFDDGKAIISRNEDQGLWTSEGSIREKKVSDMKERVKLANQHPNAILLSIHMNTYPNSSVYGCQVFYKKDDARSKELAQKIQGLINETLQSDHTKACKPIPDNLYLFKNTQNSAVLIECGFLTNQTELTKLKDENYQKQLAELIYRSTC